jgi:dCMP deaminase
MTFSRQWDAKNRPSTDWVLMTTAMSWAEKSTCPRAQVGAVISREGRSFSSGYNGAPKGMPHCNHSCTCKNDDPFEPVLLNSDHIQGCLSQQPCKNVVHAEANAIAFAARYGVGTDGAEIHCTRIPCLTCAGLIINAGIIRVVWYEEHRDMEGLLRLGEAGLEVIRWSHER